MVAKTKTKKAKASTEAPAGATGSAAPSPEGQAPQTDLSIGDLRNLSTVIDVASTRVRYGNRRTLRQNGDGCKYQCR